MKIKIVEIHFKDSKTEEYAFKKVGNLDKFHPNIQLLSIRLTTEKNHRNSRHTAFCELQFGLTGKNLIIKDSEREIDKAIDKAVERAKRALTKRKEKEASKKHRAAIKLKSEKLI